VADSDFIEFPQQLQIFSANERVPNRQVSTQSLEDESALGFDLCQHFDPFAKSKHIKRLMERILCRFTANLVQSRMRIS
jgi:hypothetical protein